MLTGRSQWEQYDTGGEATLAGITAGLGIGAGISHAGLNPESGGFQVKKKNPASMVERMLRQGNPWKRRAGIVAIPQQAQPQIVSGSYRQYKKHRPVRTNRRSKSVCDCRQHCC